MGFLPSRSGRLPALPSRLPDSRRPAGCFPRVRASVFVLVISRCRGSLGEHDSLHQWRAALLLLDRGPQAHLHRQRRHELEVAVQGNSAENLLLPVHGRHLMYLNNNKKNSVDLQKTACLTLCSPPAVKVLKVMPSVPRGPL